MKMKKGKKTGSSHAGSKHTWDLDGDYDKSSKKPAMKGKKGRR